MSSAHERQGHISKGELRGLKSKYERMLVLRRAHLRARQDPTFVEPDPRPEMAKLAEDFPGALREIDTLPLEVIVGRIDALATAEGTPSEAAPWMLAQSLFHQHLRGALATKRWLAGRKCITADLRESFERALPTMKHGQDATLFIDDLAQIAAPPRGRLLAVVHARVAKSLALSERDVRLLLHVERGSPPPEP